MLQAEASDTLTSYFDKDWKEVRSEAQAVYYRKAYELKNKRWKVEDYYK